MASVRIRAASAAVVVVDCQNDAVHESRAALRGMVGALPRAVERAGMIARIAAVIGAARAAAVPIVYTAFENRPGAPRPELTLHRATKGQQTLRAGTSGPEMHAAIRPAPGDALLLRDTGLSPAASPDLWSAVAGLSRDVLVVVGVATNFAVEGVVRAAVDRGLAVVIVGDACASVDDAWHRFAVEQILPQIATVASAEDVIAALA